MKTISKLKALEILKENPHLTKIKYCGGKYDWSKRQKFSDTDHKVGKHIKAIWLERRQDSYGPYLRIMCLADYTTTPQIHR